MSTKLILDSLQQADDGRVECKMMAPDGTVLHGIIEQSFFQEFVTSPTEVIKPEKKGRIVRDNLAYLESVSDRLWREGNRELVIK